MDNRDSLVGSQAYTVLLKQKIKIAKSVGNYQSLLEQMLVRLGAYFDDHGDLKLENKFAPSLQPNSEFFIVLSRLVQLSFPQGLATGSTDTEQLRKQIHQLRYYLDLINVYYLRHTYPNEKNDWQRLICYDVDCYKNNQPMSQPEPARLHNKLDRILNVPLTLGWNIKRVYGFHVEFILDWQGNFMYFDLKNANRIYPGQIINCSSFNYANQNDQLHRFLDVHYNSAQSIKDPSLRVLFNQNTYSPSKAKVFNTIREVKRQCRFNFERRMAIWVADKKGRENN
ncbi:DUF3114 domain-containing protein [Paucilactobacillus kaifaensis]|uniref:DUF3114 domain-containing protein n=1 Tax=Paucilactobacillus kaifaensis TaxID=2559921 RepID=UPI0010F59EBC|nr:DUF3114 domain-containing protein [Paucilactobacillus kaifaensis]